MNITRLFQKRKAIYYKSLLKYLKYILNDHFVLALLLLAGALGFTYSEYVETIQVNSVWPRIVLLFIVFGLLTLGKIRTLIEPADTLFLLPKEKELNSIMIKNLTYSIIFFSSIMIVVGFMALPLLSATEEWNTSLSLYWIVTLVVWKTNYLVFNYHTLKEHSIKTQQLMGLTLGFLSVLGLSVSLFYSMLQGLVFSFTVLAFFVWLVFYKKLNARWNWENLINSEKKRVQGIYRIINLFVETPYHSNKVRRFRALDWLFKSSKINETPYIFYLSRVFVRNTAFSGLYIRLVIIAGLFIYFTENIIVNVIISVLFLYLIGFQLLPLNQIIQQSVTFKLYPGSETDKIRSIQKLLFYLMSIVAIIFTLLAFNGEWESVLIILVSNILFVTGFVYVYSPKRLLTV